MLEEVVNDTAIVLILKCDQLETWKDENVIYKVIAKCMHGKQTQAHSGRDSVCEPKCICTYSGG
jgi:hypothetical protein